MSSTAGKSTSSGIDYSKWDKMDYGDSSDESANEEEPGRPRVTRLDGPSKVTRDADGVITIDSSSSASASAAAAASVPAKMNDKSITSAATAATAPSNMASNTGAAPQIFKSSQPTLDERLTKNGGHFSDEQTQSRIFWSQDRHEVIVSIEFDAKKIKSRNIRVEVNGMLPYGEREAAVVSGGGAEAYGKLRVTAKLDDRGENTTLLEGNLTHKIHLAEDEDDIEWEILSEDNRKLARITLRKAVPMAGVVLWWDQILQHRPKIDLSSIDGRAKQSVGMESAWEEAHRLFKEKVQKGQLSHSHPININED